MIFEKVRIIVADLFGIQKSEITQETSFYDLDASEFDMIDIAMSLEDDFAVEIDEDVLDGFETVGDIVNFIEKNL